MQIYKVLGVMSGTSLDGLDLAYCELVKKDKWEYKILSTATIPYSEKREAILRNASQLSGVELTALDVKFGKYIGDECNKFISEHELKPDIISSHGHTIFHQPQKARPDNSFGRGFTLQIGNGANIFAETGIPVVCDFRRQDVALGGQGAPLVPMGDQLLFNEFDACINLGGFANISAQYKNERVAWDICAVNTVLNHYAGQAGLKFDKGGALAMSGKLHEPLALDLLKVDFYALPPPKSLGIEWVKDELNHILEKYPISVEDILHTYVCHIAEIIGMDVSIIQSKKILLTGGGAYNNFLVEKLKTKINAEIIIPDDATVQYKEALIFALLGLLKWRSEINVLKSVTGAREDHSSGVIYGG